eukprot:IDg14768t1
MFCFKAVRSFPVTCSLRIMYCLFCVRYGKVKQDSPYLLLMARDGQLRGATSLYLGGALRYHARFPSDDRLQTCIPSNFSYISVAKGRSSVYEFLLAHVVRPVRLTLLYCHLSVLCSTALLSDTATYHADADAYTDAGVVLERHRLNTHRYRKLQDNVASKRVQKFRQSI